MNESKRAPGPPQPSFTHIMLSDRVRATFLKLLEAQKQHVPLFYRFVHTHLEAITDTATRLVSSPWHVYYSDEAGGATGMLAVMGKRIHDEIARADLIKVDEQSETVIVDGKAKYRVRTLEDMTRNRIKAYQTPDIVDSWCVLYLFVALEVASRYLDPNADQYPLVDAVFLRFMALIPASVREPLRWIQAVQSIRRGLFDLRVPDVPEIVDAERAIQAARRKATQYSYRTTSRPPARAKPGKWVRHVATHRKDNHGTATKQERSGGRGGGRNRK